MTSTIEPLPVPHTAEDSVRRVGVEIELGKLGADQAAQIFSELSGGTVEESGPRDFVVRGTEFGDIDVFLDTRFRKNTENWLEKAGFDLAQSVVPVEVVTPPIDPQMLPKLDKAVAELARRGAAGTSGNILLGFGVHLNIEIANKTPDHIGGVLTSFALLEQALRTVMQIDTTRRVLPFAAPYPKVLVDRLVTERNRGLDALMRLYLEENPTRNSALDMLPLFAYLDPQLVADHITDDLVSARPAFHYRLPDSRFDEPDWSLTTEWNRWAVVERAAEEVVLSDLCEAWLRHRAEWRGTGAPWAEECRQVLEAHGLEIPE